MKRLISLGLVLAASGGFLAYRRAAGSYNYYANTSGSVTYASGSTGTESLYWIISTAAVPDGTSSYEVNVQTGPSCVAGRKQYQLFGASPDFSGHQWTMAGSAVVLEMDHGNCSSTGVSFRVYHVIGSSWQLMSSNTGLSYAGNQAWRTYYKYDGVNYSLQSRVGATWVAGNYAQIYWGSGKPGTGSNNSSAPTTALFGPLDRVKPSAPVQAQMTAVTGYDGDGGSGVGFELEL
jgi:hypothetical protein